VVRAGSRRTRSSSRGGSPTARPADRSCGCMCSSPKCEFRWKRRFPAPDRGGGRARSIASCPASSSRRSTSSPRCRGSATGAAPRQATSTHCNAKAFTAGRPIRRARDEAPSAAAAARPDHPGRAAPDLGPAGHDGGPLRDRHRHLSSAHDGWEEAIRPRSSPRPPPCGARSPDPGPVRARPRRRVPAAGAGPGDSFFAETVPASSEDPTHPNALRGPGGARVAARRCAAADVPGAARRGQTGLRAEGEPRGRRSLHDAGGLLQQLRELGGSARIVEDEVRARADALRPPLRGSTRARGLYLDDRTIDFECVELTSREATDKVKEAKARLDLAFASSDKKPTACGRGARQQHDLGRPRHHPPRA
jgi:hypothetical protein